MYEVENTDGEYPPEKSFQNLSFLEGYGLYEDTDFT
jgi:hypothetical protein